MNYYFFLLNYRKSKYFSFIFPCILSCFVIQYSEYYSLKKILFINLKILIFRSMFIKIFFLSTIYFENYFFIILHNGSSTIFDIIQYQ